MKKSVFVYQFIFAFLMAAASGCQDEPINSQMSEVSAPKETHPYRSRLQCVRAPGSTLVGILYDISNGKRRKIGEYSSGHVGSCERAARAARHDLVCLYRGFNYVATKISTLEAVKTFGRDLDACTDYTRGWAADHVSPGYVPFMPEEELAGLKDQLPQLSITEFDDAMRDSRAIWYDESSMVFVYQDSFGDPKGLRANRVGYDVGSNSSTPDIRALTEYFKLGKFKFPFSITAGADFHDTDHVLYFWLPPKAEGKVLPVKYWRNRSHWHWVFPVGTVFGEVITLQAPDDKKFYTFEVRIRKRLADRWQTHIFRPFESANQMAQAIRMERPNWQDTDLKKLVAHLESDQTLKSHTLKTGRYKAIVPDFKGAMDSLPATQDYDLIKHFLKDRIYSDVMNSSWKKSGSLETFAATTQAAFHIVPKGYIAGMFPTTEKACMVCHDQTSRPLGGLDGRIVLYGEVWGEDQIFTWHPFEIDNDSFSVADGNRRVNRRLVRAGLLKQARPGTGDKYYKRLELPYTPKYE